MIDVSDGNKKDELLNLKKEMEGNIKDLYPIVEEDSKRSR